MTQDFLKIIQERGFLHQCSDLEGLDSILKDGVQSAYIGYDATAQSLHVGNLLGIMMLYWWQRCGHKPITLMGGGTTLVGDPSGKDSQRKMLTADDIEQNIKGIKRVFNQFLDYGDGPSDAVMVNNADWLTKLNYIEFLRDVGQYFSINRMLSFESVKSRLDREQSLSFLEFNYMIMQGYDFVHLHREFGAVLQMGGSDQWGNIINGVDLGHRVLQEQLYALTSPLLTTSSGAKMGKSVDGAVWLNADMYSPYDYYQFWRNTEDADVIRFMKLYTIMPMDEIARYEALEGQEINEAKKVLAFEATKLCHGEAEAQKAAETARQTFEEGVSAANLPTFEMDLNGTQTIIEILKAVSFASSNGEARRLISGGGARINDEVVTDDTQAFGMDDLNDDGVLKISAGKKRHALIRPLAP